MKVFPVFKPTKLDCALAVDPAAMEARRLMMGAACQDDAVGACFVAQNMGTDIEGRACSSKVSVAVAAGPACATNSVAHGLGDDAGSSGSITSTKADGEAVKREADCY